jgi:hypothetical protein
LLGTETAAGTPAGRAQQMSWLRHNRVVTGVVLAQAVWLWWVFSRGWFLQADLSNLADAVGRPPSWSYLSEPLGGHFAPVTRLTYWVFDQTARLNYPATVMFRVVCQAAATVLLYRILVRLVGRRPLVVVVLAVYAFDPVMLGGAAWFTSGNSLVLGQVLVLLTIESHLRFEETGRLLHAAATGVLLALSVLTFDQWVIAALVLPLLSVIHLYQGSVRERLRRLLVGWRAWLLILLPLCVVLVGLLRLGDPQGAAPLSLTDAYHLLRDSWLKSIGPAWVGGPWHWYAGPGTYIGFATPPDWMILLGQLGVLLTVLVGIQRLGPRSLAAWIMPVVCTVVSVLLVGYGRFETYGALLAITPRYLYELGPLIAIGVALALAPVVLQTTTHRATTARTATERTAAPPDEPAGLDRTQSVTGAAAVVAVLVMSLVSGARFAAPLSRSPVHDYVQNLQTSARAHGSEVNIYDTAVPQAVISSYEPSHRVSDILALAGVPARFDDPSSEPMVVAADGHLTKAVFVAAHTAAPLTGGSCGTFVHGVGTWTMPLDAPATGNEWFLRLQLYQAQPSEVTVEVLDGSGRAAAPITGGRVRLGRLEARNLPLPLFAPAAVRVHSSHPDTNLCLARVSVGGPFAQRSTP